MRPVLALLVIGGAASADTRPAASPPALYAKLFRDGTTWKFKADLTATHGKGAKRVTEKKTVDIACEVSRTTPTKDGWSAYIYCEGADWPFSGTAAPLVFGMNETVTANASGLLLDFANNENFRLPAVPRAVVKDAKYDDSRISLKIEPLARNGWCISHASTHSAGISYGKTLCVRDGDIIGGSSYSNTTDGSEIKRAFWGEVPR